MKHYKFIIALFITTAIIFSCNPKQTKPGTTPVDKVEKKMSYEQLAKAIGNDNALTAFDKAGLTESDPAARGGRKPKPNVQLVTVEDLLLTHISGNDFTSTVSDNAQWFSYQVFVPGAGNDGAYAKCNHYYDAANPAPDNEPCSITTSGNVRTFTSDFNYTIHLSNIVFKP